jgi:hypothetical protein
MNRRFSPFEEPSMSNENENKAAKLSLMLDLSMIAIIVLTMGLGALEGTRPFAILVGAVLYPGIGALILVGALVLTLVQGLIASGERKARGDKDFSSMTGAEEASFIPFHRRMYENGAKAAMVAIVVSVVMLLGGVAIAMMYTPCTAFCERAPSSCKGQESQWKASCPSACERFEKSSGGEEKIKQMAACAFNAGPASATCEAVEKEGVAAGLLCAEKK